MYLCLGNFSQSTMSNIKKRGISEKSRAPLLFFVSEDKLYFRCPSENVSRQNDN